MNICKSDIYFIITIILFLYLFYKINRKTENFDATSDIKTAINSVYNADVEAIRNLSSIASTLIANGGLVVPGNLNITDTILVDTGKVGNTSKGFIETKYGGKNSDRYGIGQGGNGAMRMYTSSAWTPATACLSLAKDDGSFNDIVTVKTDGSTSITNNLFVKTSDPGKQVQIGSSQIKFRGDGSAHYALTNDNGTFKIGNWSGTGDLGTGFINDCITTDSAGTTSVKALYTMGGTVNNPGGSGKDRWGTHFPFVGDGKNYIRGETVINGNIDLQGSIYTLNVNTIKIGGWTIGLEGPHLIMRSGGGDRRYAFFNGTHWNGNGN